MVAALMLSFPVYYGLPRDTQEYLIKSFYKDKDKDKDKATVHTFNVQVLQFENDMWNSLGKEELKCIEIPLIYEVQPETEFIESEKYDATDNNDGAKNLKA